MGELVGQLGDFGPRTGAQLRDAGLNARALAAWAGTDRLSALPARMAQLATRELTPASTVLAVFVAGVEVPVGKLRGDLGDLVEVRGGVARAKVAVLPLGRALMVCDRGDAAAETGLVCWPDDSSYHLARSLPAGRVERWIDVGCGSAFAPLARPELANVIVATDANPRAIEMARLGAALSGIRIEVVEADLAAGIEGGAQLVSCNAPIPGGDGPMWRAAAADFVARLVPRARALVAPGGMIVIHAALDALVGAVEREPGERVVVRYTPDGVPAFGVLWWRPDAGERLVVGQRALTADHPHLTYADREIV